MNYVDLIREVIDQKDQILFGSFFVDNDDLYISKYSPFPKKERKKLLDKIKSSIKFDTDDFSSFDVDIFYKDILPRFPEMFSVKEILHIILSSVLLDSTWILNDFDIKDDPWFVSLVELLELIHNKDDDGILIWKLKN